MAYASLSDIVALTAGRAFTASTIPNTSQVVGFLDQTAAVIDSMLVEKGYSLPIPTTASSALLLLRQINSLGAWAQTERAAQLSEQRDFSQQMWESSLAMLRAQSSVLDIPKNETRASPRGPGVTVAPNTPAGAFDPNFPQYNQDGQIVPALNPGPYFSRDQRF